MTWLSLALVTAGIQSLVAIADKVVIERYFRDAWSFTFLVSAFLGLYSIIILVVRALSGQFTFPSLLVLLVGLLPGVLQFIGSFFYTRALLRADAATVSAFNQTVPIFALVWGWIFFGNVFGILSYLGIATIVICCALLGLEQSAASKRLRLNPAVGFVLLGALMRSLADLFIRLTLNGQDYWNTFALSRAALLPIALLMLTVPGYRKILGAHIRAHGVRVFPAMGIYEALAMLPLLLSVIAYAEGPFALVSTILYSTPSFVLLFTILINSRFPGLVPVRPGQPGTLQRATLLGGVLVGILLLRS